LISGRPVILPLVREYGVSMLPADSEHSAIFQCLQGVPEGGLRRIILTASGGAFRDLTKEELFHFCENDPRAVQAKATTHPNWDMGAKITLDSATMMNKGLEVRYSSQGLPFRMQRDSYLLISYLPLSLAHHLPPSICAFPYFNRSLKRTTCSVHPTMISMWSSTHNPSYIRWLKHKTHLASHNWDGLT